MKECILFSPFDCEIDLNEKIFPISANEHLTFLCEKDFLVLKKDKKFLINLDHEKSFYHLLKKDDKIYIFLLDGILLEKSDVFSLKHANFSCKINVSSKQVKIISENKDLNFQMTEPILNFDCGNFFHIAFVLTKFEKTKQIFLYNMKNNKILSFKGEITLTKNGFVRKVFSPQYSIDEEYVITEKGLTRKNFSSSLKSNLPTQSLPYYFCETIKNRDYEKALSLCSEKLKKATSESDLKKYFSPLNYFCFFEKNKCYVEISSSNKHVLEFYLENGKIDDIDAS